MVEKEKLNESELKAYKWLLRKYRAEDIDFGYNRSIDFIVLGKIPYEVKTSRNGEISFTKKQYENFKQSNPTILIFEKSKDDPIAVIPFSDVESKFKVRIIQSYHPKGRFEMKITVNLPKPLMEFLEEKVRIGAAETLSQAVRQCIILAKIKAEEKNQDVGED